MFDLTIWHMDSKQDERWLKTKKIIMTLQVLWYFLNIHEYEPSINLKSSKFRKKEVSTHENFILLGFPS